MQKLSQIQAILTQMQSTSYADVQSIDKLLEYGFQLQQHLAFSGEAMAEARENLHLARQLMTEKLLRSGQKMARSTFKDYVNDACAKEAGYYELAERCNRSCTHSLDFVRTAISALKAEMQSINFQPNY
ncbi:MAG TPA: hypothetical protein PLX17_11985 [Chitinophagaceae bacterium]|jgi:hypothetical protein|nr:hypothetical protein [Chitinophagaceae bacterium]